jgi:hypothetical protein
MAHSPHTDRAQEILSTLSEWQYLRPHRPLADVLADVVVKLGVCSDAAQSAIERLELDAARPIGRLRATELNQLARCIGRLWEQSAVPHRA